MKRSYLFDTEIAPLTEEEKEIMLKCRKFINKRNKIYERTDKVIREYRKKEKAKEKALEVKRLKELEKQKILEKQKQIEIQKQKELEFPDNYIKFKTNFNNIIGSINFYNKKEKMREIESLQKDFGQHCIHPINFKSRGTYRDGDCGGGMGYSYDSCDACNLCKLGLDKHGSTYVSIDYTPAIENDLLDIISKIEM